MDTKLSQIKKNAATGNWAKAINIASKFPDLGEQRNAILDANLAITNPRWVAGLGKDINKSVADGILALKVRYNI